MALTDEIVLELEWRIIKRPSGDFQLSIGCGDGCEGRLDVIRMLDALPVQTWVKSYIPLQCFVSAGLDPDDIDVGLELETDSEAIIDLYSAAFIKTRSILPGCP